jgi:hypothetical protein
MFFRILSGRFISRKEHAIYLAATVAFYSACQIIALFFFPDNYSIVDNKISEQGNPILNPLGHWFFNIGSVLTGILAIPHFLYIYRKLSIFPGNYFNNLLNQIAAGFSLTGAIGLSFVGFFPEVYGLIHIYISSVTFGGLCAGAFVIFAIMLIRKAIRERLKSKWHLLLAFMVLSGQLILVWSISGILFLIDEVVWYTWNWGAWLLAHPVWEWTQFLSIMMWVIGLPILISNRIFEPKEINTKKKR